jgi:hypothetical protein
MDFSWNRSFQIEPKETIDNTDHHQQQKLQEDPSPTTYRTRPLKAYRINHELIILFFLFS